MYEGFCMSFLTQLNRTSSKVMEELICNHFVKRISKSQLTRVPRSPGNGPRCLCRHLQANHFDAAPAYGATPTEGCQVLVPLTHQTRFNRSELMRCPCARGYGQAPLPEPLAPVAFGRRSLTAALRVAVAEVMAGAVA